MSLLDTIKNLFFGEKTEAPVVNTPEPTEPTESPEPVAVEKVVAEKEQIKDDPIPQAAPVKVQPTTSKQKDTGLKIPEDSTLRRHFISALQVEIESSMPNRPTDSALKRHYDSAVQAKLASLLSQ